MPPPSSGSILASRDAEAHRLAQSIIYYSVNHGLDARLIMAVIAAKSNFNVNAVSRTGAMGLGQLMPGTAQGLGVADPWHPDQNLEGATRLLRGHLAASAPATRSCSHPPGTRSASLWPATMPGPAR